MEVILQTPHLRRRLSTIIRKACTKRILITLCTLILLLLIFREPFPGRNQFSTSSQPSSRARSRLLQNLGTKDTINCATNLSRIAELKARYELRDTFQYTKRLVHFTRKKEVKRKDLTKLSQRLLQQDFQLIQSTHQTDTEFARCYDAIEIPVSASEFPQNTDGSKFMFGISTTYERFVESAAILLEDWSYWLTDGSGRSNGCKLVLMLLDTNQEKLDEIKSRLAAAGIDADTYSSNASLPMAARNMALIPTMYSHPDANKKKWLVLCDDDTFFPNMNALIERLEGHDHTRELYIGALSEDSLAIQKHGPQAFGGAGVFLSLPMAEKIARFFSDCSLEENVRKADWQGDRLLHQCIQEHSEAQLTAFPDLWQLDMFGDPSGFYESGMKPLSLHHYRSWHHVTPSLLTKIAYICGEDCTLQRFQTSDNFIISGFSIAQYPGGINFDTHQVERTFGAENDVGWNFDYKMGPQRATLAKTGRKLSWEIQESSFQDNGTVLQTYIRRGHDARWVDEDNKPLNEHDSVIELVWSSNT